MRLLEVTILARLRFKICGAPFLCAFLLAAALLRADVGDPQIRTDHPWYPGELAISTFERLAATEAEQYERATGIKPQTDEQRALAAWFFRNTHYAHGEEGAENLWGTGFTKGDLRTREYWTGLFADGFGLCGTTHSQWTAEMEHLLGHACARGVGVEGHNSFEVWLTGGAYGAGRWALLDHDISTVIYDTNGTRLLSIPEIKADVQRWTDRKFLPDKQHGWVVCGLHPNDGSVYRRYSTAEYLPGYEGAPPLVHLRRGETFRRYLHPGLDDGKTFVFWGRNYNTAGIPGPERSQTWVNQPENMFRSKNGSGYKAGQARFGNARYSYTPNFKNGSYREGVVNESDSHVTFEFYSPYIIGATAPNTKPWGIYDAGCSNGLVVSGHTTALVSVSTDQGATWSTPQPLRDGLDLTDHVKGYRQYFLRFEAGAHALADAGLEIRTVCQANVATMPRLKDGRTTVTFSSSRHAVVSAGPTKQQAAAHVVRGAFGSPQVTLALSAPHGEAFVELHAAAHIGSGNPPDPKTKYSIECSTDGGATWKPAVKDWTIARRGEEPADFWSQSFCYGSLELDGAPTNALVRFRNDGGRPYLRAEAHVVYQTSGSDPARVTFGWADGAGLHQASHEFQHDDTWLLPTGSKVDTQWVEFADNDNRPGQ